MTGVSARRVAARVAAGAAARLDLLQALGVRRAAAHRRELHDYAAHDEAFRSEVYGWIWRDAAADLGAEVRPCGQGSFELSRDGRTTRARLFTTELEDRATAESAGDRAAVHGRLGGVGLAVPRHLELASTDLRRGLRFLAEAEGPCVVKPASGTGAGWGITCGVRRRADLARAVLEASRYASRVLLEEQAPGSMYRILVLDGEVIATVRRDPPHLTGDGRSTVGELVAAENRNRMRARGWAGLAPLRLDRDSLFTLRASGLGVRSVPPAGHRVAVKTSTNNSGPLDHEPQEAIGDELAADAVAAAHAAGLRLAGIDVVTPDPMRSLRAAGGALIEINPTPAFHHHYLVRDSASAQRVAVPVLRRLLERALEM